MQSEPTAPVEFSGATTPPSTNKNRSGEVARARCRRGDTRSLPNQPPHAASQLVLDAKTTVVSLFAARSRSLRRNGRATDAKTRSADYQLTTECWANHHALHNGWVLPEPSHPPAC